MSWQPIETAPKDGLVLLAVGEGEYRKSFVAEMSHEDGEEVWCITTGWVGWTNLHSAWEPTHWMPLPPPPGVEP